MGPADPERGPVAWAGRWARGLPASSWNVGLTVASARRSCASTLQMTLTLPWGQQLRSYVPTFQVPDKTIDAVLSLPLVYRLSYSETIRAVLLLVACDSAGRTSLVGVGAVVLLKPCLTCSLSRVMTAFVAE